MRVKTNWRRRLKVPVSRVFNLQSFPLSFVWERSGPSRWELNRSWIVTVQFFGLCVLSRTILLPHISTKQSRAPDTMPLLLNRYKSFQPRPTLQKQPPLTDDGEMLLTWEDSPLSHVLAVLKLTASATSLPVCFLTEKWSRRCQTLLGIH